MALSEVVRALNAHQRFLVTAHTNPDGDAAGSLLAMWRLLATGLGKYAIAVTPDPFAPRYQFLPGLEDVLTVEQAAGAGPYDAIVSVDVSNADRMGGVQRLITPGMTRINIDHHVTNPREDDVPWVDTGASATCEMIYDLFRAYEITPDEHAATALYTGIYTDTGQFAYAGTSAKALRAAADLVSFGADYVTVARQVFRRTQLPVARTLGLVLNRLEMFEDDRLALSFMTRDEQDVDHEGFVNHLLDIDTVEVAALLRPQGETAWKVSFRSAGRVDVARMSKTFGGGGHQMAAGATIEKPFAEARRLVIDLSTAAIRQALVGAARA